VLAPVPPLELRELPGREQPPAAAHRLQAVLREKEWVLLAQPLSLRFHVAPVRRVVLRNDLPAVLEVAADAVAALQLQVTLLRPLQQRAVVPRRAVEHRRRVACRRHRPELAVELLLVHVLRLVHLQQQPRAVAGDLRLQLG
jgi:hypothetical protein